MGDPVHDAGSARELDHLLAVPAAQRIIEVEHDLGLVVLRRILDEGLEARGSALLLSTGPPGVVDHRLDPEHVAHPDDRVGDLAPPWVTLALPMETALARKDQGPQLFAGDGQLRPEAGRGDRPSTSGCRSLRALGQVSTQVAGTAADMRHVRADSKKEISSLAMGSGSSSGAK
jgi:hypothetical protein